MNSRITIAMLAALLTGCSATETELEPAAEAAATGFVALRLSSGIRGAQPTRAYDTSWEAGDQIGVFATAAGTTTPTSSGGSANANVAYTTSSAADTYSGGSYTYRAFSAAATPVFMPVDGTSVDIYAYSPYTAGVSASSPLAVTIESQQTLAGQKGSDVLTARKRTTTSAPINADTPEATLLFSHCLSKVLIRVVAGTGFTSAMLTGHTSVKLTGQPTAATFAPLTQTLSITTGAADIVPLTLADGDADYSRKGAAVYIYRALLLPNNNGENPATSTGREIVVTVGQDDVVATYTYTITKTFSAGEETVFTLTLGAKGLSVSTAIMPWDAETINEEEPIYES